MRDHNYQYEINVNFKVPVDGGTFIDSVTIIRNYVVVKVGKYASFYDYHNNPEGLIHISDGNITITIELDPMFTSSTCLQNRGVEMFPYFLLSDFFQRETLSEHEMMFTGENGSAYQITAKEGKLVKWRGLEVRDFRFDQIYAFKDPEQLGVTMEVERECSDYITNMRKFNANLEALKNE